jgi:hypothetical protein
MRVRATAYAAVTASICVSSATVLRRTLKIKAECESASS